jgi:hypothetical protein
MGRKKTDSFEVLNSIKIESGIEPPPQNLTSPWSYFAMKMKVGDSVEVERYDYLLRLKYNILRFGFGITIRKLGESRWRIWKIKKTGNKPNNPSIPDRVYYGERNQIIISGSKKVRVKK